MLVSDTQVIPICLCVFLKQIQCTKRKKKTTLNTAGEWEGNEIRNQLN